MKLYTVRSSDRYKAIPRGLEPIAFQSMSIFILKLKEDY